MIVSLAVSSLRGLQHLSQRILTALARLVEADPTLTLDSAAGRKLEELAGNNPDALMALYRLRERAGDHASAWGSTCSGERG